MIMKEEFLKPLDEDRELRLTAVEKLGYGDILKNSKDVTESSA